MDLKTQNFLKVSEKENASGEGAPGSEDILFLTSFTIDFLYFEVHFSRSVGVLREDSISGHELV